MSGYEITTCSTAYLTQEAMDKYGLKYAMFSYIIDNVSYKDDLYKSITPKKFYKMIMDGAAPTTSQVSTADYLDLWSPILSDGKDVIHLCLSSGISGTYNSAKVAVEMAAEKYPDRKVIAIDTLTASPGLSLLAAKAAENKAAGMSFEDNTAWIKDHLHNDQTWFFSSDLTCFIRGGRISKVAGTFGQLLNICPLMYVAKDGTRQVEKKLRGRKNAIKGIVSTMESLAEDRLGYSGKVMITHSDCYEDARAVADLIEKTFPKMKEKPEIYDIGTVIGSHTGIGTVALAFWGDEKTK